MVTRIKVSDALESVWAKRLNQSDVAYFDIDPMTGTFDKLELYHAHYNIKHSIRNFIMQQIITNKRSSALKSRFKCVDREKNNGKKTGLFSDQQLYDLFRFSLEEHEI